MTDQKANDTITAGILRKCLTIHEERNKQYGTSESNFADIARIATSLSLTDKQFTPLDIVVCMIATKEVRYKYAINHTDMKNRDKVIADSLLDWINYLAIMENVRILTAPDTDKDDLNNEPELSKR